MGTPEINNCSYNLDLGMRFEARPTTFCRDLFVNGNLFVKGSITEGEPLPPDSSSGSGSCFDRLKISDGFRVEGDACFKKGVNIDLDLRVKKRLACEEAKVLKNLKVDESLCVGKTAFISDSAQVNKNLKVNGRFIVGEGNVDCEKIELEEAKVVLEGKVLATEDIHVKNTVIKENSFSLGSVSNTTWADRLVVRGYVYRERTIEVMEDGVPVTLTVLVKDKELPPPLSPDEIKSCPISVACVDVAVPSPPCPEISCD